MGIGLIRTAMVRARSYFVTDLRALTTDSKGRILAELSLAELQSPIVKGRSIVLQAPGKKRIRFDLLAEPSSCLTALDNPRGGG